MFTIPTPPDENLGKEKDIKIAGEVQSKRILSEHTATQIILPSKHIHLNNLHFLASNHFQQNKDHHFHQTNLTIKMRFTSTSAALFLSTLISSSSAIITGVTAPSTVYAYNPFTITLTTADYIQSVYDVAVAFGVAPGAGFPDSLGNVMSTAYLGPSKSNILTPITFDVTLPAGAGNGEYVLTAAVYSLLGAASEPSVAEYNTTITIAGF
jgi:hypothetical protein